MAAIAPVTTNPLVSASSSGGMEPSRGLKELPLDREQQERLERMVFSPFNFSVEWPFVFEGVVELRQLMQNFERLLSQSVPGTSLTSLRMIGSMVTDVLQDKISPSGDIDFFCTLNQQVSNRTVEVAFLEALRETLGISEMRGTYMSKGRFLAHMEEGETLFNTPKFRLLKSLRCGENGSFYARIPLTLEKRERDLDFTIVSGEAEPGCFSSKDCFSIDILPKLRGTDAPVCVAALKGYDIDRAWRFLNEGYYEVIDSQAEKLRSGLRGYARLPTKGLRPVQFSSESVYGKKWAEEYKDGGLPKFFNELATYLPLHYRHDFPATLAYLTNLRTIFEGQGALEEFLREFDRESSQLLDRIFRCRGSDFSFLRTVGFWGYFRENRLDCSEGAQESRFQFPLPSGHMLAHIPWKETAQLCSMTAEEIGEKWAMSPFFMEKLQLSWPAVRRNLDATLPKLHSDPKGKLFQYFLSDPRFRIHLNQIWEVLTKSNDLSEALWEIMQLVGDKELENRDFTAFVIENLATLPASPKVVRTIFKKLPPVWLDSDRSSLQCWRILQKATGGRVAPNFGLSHTGRAYLLKILFRSEDPKQIWREMIEMGKNPSLLRDFIAFGKFLDAAPLFNDLLPEDNLPQILVKICKDRTTTREVLTLLASPENKEIQEECFPALMNHLRVVELSNEHLEMILRKGPFSALEKFLSEAIQRRLPFLKQELMPILRRLDKPISQSIQERVTEYLKDKGVLEADWIELFENEILPVQPLWELAVRTRFNADLMLDFSRRIRSKGGELPIEIRNYWKEAVPSSEISFLTRLLDEEILSPEEVCERAKMRPTLEWHRFSMKCIEMSGSGSKDFRNRIISQLKRQLMQPLFFKPYLDPKTSPPLPRPLVGVVAEAAIKDRKEDKALDLLLTRMEDAIEEMPLQELWDLINSLGRVEQITKLEPLIEKANARTNREEPYSLWKVAAQIPKALLPKYETQLFSLFKKQFQKLSEAPILEIWKQYASIFEADGVPREFKDFFSCFMIPKIGPEILRVEEGSEIWMSLVKEALKWTEIDEVHLQHLRHLVRNFKVLTRFHPLTDPELFIELVVKVDRFDQGMMGDQLLNYLEQLESSLSGHEKKQSVLTKSWVKVCDNFHRCRLPGSAIERFVVLRNRVRLSIEEGLVVDLSMFNYMSNYVKSLALMKRQGNLQLEKGRLKTQIGEFHKCFMRSYEDLMNNKGVRVYSQERKSSGGVGDYTESRMYFKGISMHIEMLSAYHEIDDSPVSRRNTVALLMQILDFCIRNPVDISFDEFFTLLTLSADIASEPEDKKLLLMRIEPLVHVSFKEVTKERKLAAIAQFQSWVLTR